MAKKPADSTDGAKSGKGASKGATAVTGKGKKAKTPKVKKQRFARTRELKQAYTMLKPNDPRLGLYIGLAALAEPEVLDPVLLQRGRQVVDLGDVDVLGGGEGTEGGQEPAQRLGNVQRRQPLDGA